MKTTSSIKAATRGVYDLQKLRIQTGNRLCANWRATHGQAPGESEAVLSAEDQDTLKVLRKHYKLITEGLLAIPRRRDFTGDEVISSYAELVLISQYEALLSAEARQFKDLEILLEEYPIYNEFLEPTRGIGPAMAAVIVSELDITKAKYASSLWKYAGLDVVTYFYLKDRFHPDAPTVLYERHPDGFKTQGPAVIMPDSVFFLLKDGVPYGSYGLDSTQPGQGEGRSRRKPHLVQRSYTDREGNHALRMSLTFNPFLKTKLTGVLGPSFLRARSPYRAYYDAYKTRIEQLPQWAARTPKHRHNAAIRYMVKRFLVDLYTNWRALEGLEVYPEYAVAKLGSVNEVLADAEIVYDLSEEESWTLS